MKNSFYVILKKDIILKYNVKENSIIWLKSFEKDIVKLIIVDPNGVYKELDFQLSNKISNIILTTPKKTIFSNIVVYIGYSKEFETEIHKHILNNKHRLNTKLIKLRKKYLDFNLKYVGKNNWGKRIDNIENFLSSIENNSNLKSLKRKGDEISFYLGKNLFIFGVNYGIMRNSNLKNGVEIVLFELGNDKTTISSTVRYCKSVKLPQIIADVVKKYDLRY